MGLGEKPIKGRAKTPGKAGFQHQARPSPQHQAPWPRTPSPRRSPRGSTGSPRGISGDLTPSRSQELPHTDHQDPPADSRQPGPAPQAPAGTISCGATGAIRDRTPQHIGITPGQGKPTCRASAQPPQDIPQAPPIQGDAPLFPILEVWEVPEKQRKNQGLIKARMRKY